MLRGCSMLRGRSTCRLAGPHADERPLDLKAGADGPEREQALDARPAHVLRVPTDDGDLRRRGRDGA